jgi:hypothetical protein
VRAAGRRDLLSRRGGVAGVAGVVFGRRGVRSGVVSCGAVMDQGRHAVNAVNAEAAALGAPKGNIRSRRRATRCYKTGDTYDQSRTTDALHCEVNVAKWRAPVGRRQVEGFGVGMAAGGSPSPKTDGLRRPRSPFRRSVSGLARDFAGKRTGVRVRAVGGREACPLRRDAADAHRPEPSGTEIGLRPRRAESPAPRSERVCRCGALRRRGITHSRATASHRCRAPRRHRADCGGSRRPPDWPPPARRPAGRRPAPYRGSPALAGPRPRRPAASAPGRRQAAGHAQHRA